MLTNGTDRDEGAIIQAILEGNTELYHELIRPYEKSVFMMALSLMKNPTDAEDVAQEAFLKAFRKLSCRGKIQHVAYHHYAQ